MRDPNNDYPDRRTSSSMGRSDTSSSRRSSTSTAIAPFRGGSKRVRGNQEYVRNFTEASSISREVSFYFHPKPYDQAKAEQLRQATLYETYQMRNFKVDKFWDSSNYYV
jgi:hypothetical protein